MAVVTITTMARFWCDCGNLFGISGWPVPSWTDDTLDDRRCNLCMSIYYAGRLFCRVERPADD